MSDKLQLLPISGKDLSATGVTKERKLSIARLLFVGFAIPPIGLTYFIISTLILDYEAATYTDCEVLDVLPSVSAIARAQLMGWKLVTWIILPFRLMIACLYSRYYRQVFSRGCFGFGWLALPCFIYESLSTIIMARWAHISGDTTFHKASVLSIWFASFGYIAISFVCFKQHQRHVLESHQKLSFMLKRKVCITYFSGTLCMWWLYFLHTDFCLPLAYTFFALCEYIVSWSLMGYLWTSVLDFYPLYLCYNAQQGFHLIFIIN